MPNEDVYTISVEDVPNSTEEIFTPRTAPAPGPHRTTIAQSGSNGIALASRGSKRPVVASTLSLLICGAGQLFNRQVKLGLLFLLVETLVIVSHWAMIQMWSSLRSLADVFGITEAQMMLGVVVFDFIVVLFILAGVYQAYRHSESTDGVYEGIHVPILSGLASFVFPGWGQLINGQLGKALFFFFVLFSALIVGAFLALTPIFALLTQMPIEASMLQRLSGGTIGILATAGLMWILSIYDAVLVAGFHRHYD